MDCDHMTVSQHNCLLVNVVGFGELSVVFIMSRGKKIMSFLKEYHKTLKKDSRN